MGDFLALMEEPYDFIVQACITDGTVIDSTETDDLDEAYIAYRSYCEWAESPENEFFLVCVTWYDYTGDDEDIRKIKIF